MCIINVGVIGNLTYQLEYDKIIVGFIYLFIVLFNLFVYLFSGLSLLEIVFGGEELTL